MTLVLLGAPGVGKGTQAKLLSEGLAIPHISTGDILREEIKNNTELGKKAKSYLESGELVPDSIVNQLVEKRIKEPDTVKGFVLDGFPRNLEQASILDGILTRNERTIDLVIYLTASQRIILERLTGRRVCRQCGANFHVKNMPPKKEGVCDSCSGELYQRPDDNAATIENRLNVYLGKTKPIISYYEKQGKLTKVDSDPDAPKVYKLLLDMIKKYNHGNHKN